MDGNILDLPKKYDHLASRKPQYSPHKHRLINYGAKQHMVQPTDTSLYLDDKGIKRVQGSIGSLLYVVISVNNKLLLELIAIVSLKPASTVEK